MADSEQAFQDDTAIYRALAVVGVDTPIAPPLTGDEGGQTPSSEYFLHFKVVLVPQRWAGASHRRWVWVWSLVVCFGHCGLPDSHAANAAVGFSSAIYFQP